MELRPSPREIFLADVPPGFLEATYHLLLQVYRTSYTSCEANLRREFAKSLWPYARANQFHSDWINLAGRYPGVVTASPEWNDGHNCAHAEVRFGRVVWTAHVVSHRLEPVRYARYRETLAQSNEPYLFELEDQAPLPPETRLYAYLIHSPAEGMPKSPYFMDVVFPNQFCNAYIPPRIDLMDMFGRARRAPEEPVDDDLDLGPHENEDLG